MFFKYLEKLRNMPERRKRIFAFLFAFVITLIVFIIWYTLSFSRLSVVEIPVKSAIDESLGPFKMLQDSIKENLKIIGF